MNALAVAKSRLAAALAPEGRRALVLWMAERVLRAVVESGGVEQVAVVSPDPSVLDWASQRHAHPLHQAAGDLNAGVEVGRRWAAGGGADALLVLFGDLPLLSAGDVSGLLDVAGEPGAASRLTLAPDRAERGTNGLVMRPLDALPFLFGPDSLARFTRAARDAHIESRLVRRAGTAFDVDTPAQLAELLALDVWTPEGCDATVSMAGGGR